MLLYGINKIANIKSSTLVKTYITPDFQVLLELPPSDWELIGRQLVRKARMSIKRAAGWRSVNPAADEYCTDFQHLFFKFTAF